MLIGLATIGLTNAQSWVFAEQFSSTGDVDPVDIKVDGNGDVYIVGNYISDLTIGGLAPLTYTGVDEDIFLCKFSDQGVAQWAVRIGGDAKELVGGLAIDPGNDVYVVGGFRSPTLSFGGGTTTLTNQDNYDAFMAKYNGSGVLQFADSVFWGDDVERLLDVEYDFTNDLVIVVGQFKTELRYDDGGEQIVPVVGTASKNHILARFDPSGNFNDIEIFHGSHQHTAFKNVNNSVIGSAVTGYFVAGDLRDSLYFQGVDTIHGDPANRDILLIKVDDNLAYQWSRTGGGTLYEHINSSGSDGNGNIYFAGKAQSTSIVLDSTATLKSAPREGLGAQDFMIAKYNRDGNLQWFRIDGGTGTDDAFGLDVKGDRILYTGNIEQGGNPQSGFAVYDAGGGLIAYDSITGDGTETGLNVSFDESGDSTLVIGNFNGTSLQAGPVLTLSNTTVTGETDGFFVKYGFKFSIFEADKTNILCNGDSTGSIEVGTQFGTEPITYAWDPDVSSGPVATGLKAGTYTIIATDDEGRSDTIEIVLTESPPINITVQSIVPTSCHTSSTGGTKNDGQVNITVSGGTLPFNYFWSPSGETTEDAASLTAGANTVTITDGYGCIKDTTFMVPQPDSITFFGSTVDTIFIGGDPGAVNLSVQGGTPAYTYDWSGPSGYSSSSASISGLTNQGDYDLSLTDANLCVQDTTFNVPSDTGLSIIICELSDVTCKGDDDGVVKVCVTAGGTGNYTYAWRTIMGVPIGLDQDRLSGVAPGTYIVRVTDNGNGRFAEKSFEIAEPAIPLGVITDSLWNVSCPGDEDGAIFISVTGGWGPESYSWMPSGRVTKDLVGVEAREYTVTVTDSGGCIVQYAETVGTPEAIVVSIDEQTPLNCPDDMDGALIANVSGGVGPYTYLWDDPGAQTTQIATNLGAGTYMVMVTDANGCTEAETDTLPSNALTIESIDKTWDGVDSTATITVNISSGRPDYTYTLTGGNNDTTIQVTTSGTSHVFTDLEGGDYFIDVTDQCMMLKDSLNVGISVVDLRIGYDLLIYPNPSNGRFTIEMENPDREDIDLEIINLMGQRVFRQLYESYGESRFIQTLDLSDQAGGAYFIRINRQPVKAKLMIE